MMQMMTRTAIHPLKIVAAVGAALLVWGLLFTCLSSPAQAAQVTVDSLSDTVANDGHCTLREAITSANNDPTSVPAAGECANGSGADVINFALAGTAPWTVNLGSALPNLSTNIQIKGPGADKFTVRRNTGDDYSIFTIAGDTTEVSISGMTISNGDAVVCGGGISIPDNGTLTVTDSIISGNSAGFDGGGICNAGPESTVTVTDSTIAHNSAIFGGGIRNDGILTVSGSTISENSASQGGGIENLGGILGGTLTVSGSTISDNTAGGSTGGRGGGIHSFVGTAKISGSTISGNTASGGSSSGADGGWGGGIYYESVNGNLTVTDSTISDNSATAGQPLVGQPAGSGGQGGGIYTDSELNVCGDPASATSTTTITNSTISGNSAADGVDRRGEVDVAGGGIFNFDGPTAINNSTITNNTAPDEFGSGVASFGDDCTPTEVFSSIISANQGTDVDFVFDPTNSFTSNGYNLIGDGNATGHFNNTGDQLSTDPKLGALADNGGPTETHALRAGSPAIDKGNTDLSTDQRGQHRPFDDPSTARATGGDDSDIGAFEAQSVLINTAPEAKDDDATTNEDTPVSVNVLSNDTDPDTGDDLDIASFGQGQNGSVSCNNETGECTYTPNPNFNGEDSFTYKATDGTADSNVATVKITVTAVNDKPVAKADAYATDEDTALNIGAAAGVLSNDEDVDGDALKAVLVDDVAHGTLDLNDDGSFDYTPAPNYNGHDSFTYKANDETVDSDTATVSITVNAVNDAPVANPDTKTTDEDTPLTFPSSDLVANDNKGAANESAQTLTVTDVFDGTHGTVSLSGGNITFTPEANFSGTATFDYRVCDNGSPQECSVQTATVDVTVNPVNDAPTADGQSVSTPEDTAKPITLIASDVEGDSLTYSVVSGPSHGTLSGTGANRTYTPAADYNGSDSFTFKANDGQADSNVATVSITVNSVNDAPVAEDQSVSTAEDDAKGITLGASDVDGDALTYDIVSGPTHGTLNGSGNSRTYTPDPDYVGSDSFTFKANDGTAESNTATVTIRVTPVNDAPKVAVERGGSCSTIDTSGTLKLRVSDVDNRASSLNLSPSSSKPQLVPNANITFSGTAAIRRMHLSTVSGNSGTALVGITVSDASLTSTENVTVKVGTNATNTITGTQGTDMLFGLGGADTLGGIDGNDLYCAGDGDDTLDGAKGDETLFGGPGKDLLRAAGGDDRLFGGGEDDRLFGASGADTMRGGGGADRFSGGTGTDTATDFDASQGDTMDNTIP